MKNQLPDIVIVNLFKDKLVLVNENQPDSRKDISTGEVTQNNESDIVLPEIWWLGKNKKNIVVLLNDQDNKFISEANLSFLLNIINACKLTTDDIAIVNMANTLVDYTQLKSTLSPTVVLSFKVQPKTIGLNVEAQNYQTFLHDNCTWLCAASLDELNGNTSEKKLEKVKLWNALKKIFNL